MAQAVIIVSLFKAEAFLDDLFGSLERSYKECDWMKVVAVDDRSPDRSFELVRGRYPWVDLIQTPENLGFAKANNFATEYALKKHDPVFLFYLNQDTEVEKGFLEKLVEVLNSDSTVGIVQPLLMIHPFSAGLINSTGSRLHFLGYGYTDDEGRGVLQYAPTKTKDIAYASGAAFMIRATLVKRFGLFDPFYIAYHEDTDLSLRVWKEGYHVVLCPDSRVAHKYTTPSQVKEKLQKNRNAYYWIERNRFVLFAKFYSTRMLALFSPAFVVNEVGVMVFSFFHGFWKERIRMYCWLATHWGELLEIRKNSKLEMFRHFERSPDSDRDEVEKSQTVESRQTNNEISPLPRRSVVVGRDDERKWERKLMSLFSTEIWHGNADSAVLGLANIFWKMYFWAAGLFINDTTKIHDRESL